MVDIKFEFFKLFFLLVGEVPFFSTLSPPELLDRHIQLGNQTHAKELSHMTLTSKEPVNWTHFGGRFH